MPMLGDKAIRTRTFWRRIGSLATGALAFVGPRAIPHFPHALREPERRCPSPLRRRPVLSCPAAAGGHVQGKGRAGPFPARGPSTVVRDERRVLGK
jgi:hypothetical protein